MEARGPRTAVVGMGTAWAMGVAACGGSGDTGFGPGVDGGPVRDGTAHKLEAGGQSANVSEAGEAASSATASQSDAAPEASRPVDAGQDSAPPPILDAHFEDRTGLQFPIVYGQSGSVLYSVDPDTNAVTRVGVFSGCGGEVIDIALDKSSNMYATSFQGVYTVDTSNAHCTLLAAGTTYPNSLSFVPAGTVDPAEEALVGYEGSTYVRIDTTTGALTTIGSLGDSYTSSGDIVSVIGGATYLTVTGAPDCSSADCLVEVNPTTGALVTNLGSVQHVEVYGLAFWAGNVYGFDSAGQLFEVAFPDAGGLALTPIPIPNRPLGLSFNGAGSTTSAPFRSAGIYRP